MKKIIMYLSAFLPMFWLILIKDYATILKDAIEGKAKYSDLLSVQLFIGWHCYRYHNLYNCFDIRESRSIERLSCCI